MGNTLLARRTPRCWVAGSSPAMTAGSATPFGLAREAGGAADEIRIAGVNSRGVIGRPAAVTFEQFFAADEVVDGNPQRRRLRTGRGDQRRLLRAGCNIHR